MNLQEVQISESIIKMKSLLKRNIDISSLCSPSSSTSSIKDYAQGLLLNDHDHLHLTEYSQQVAVYISGYISVSLAERLKCPDFLCSLQNNSFIRVLQNLKPGWFNSFQYIYASLCIECILLVRSYKRTHSRFWLSMEGIRSRITGSCDSGVGYFVCLSRTLD